MCLLCGHMIGEPHWTERSRSDEAGRRQARYTRTRVVGRVLHQYNLTVHEDLSGTQYVVGNEKGAEEVVQHLGQLWLAADRMAGRQLDPLDGALLDRLEGGGQ